MKFHCSWEREEREYLYLESLWLHIDIEIINNSNIFNCFWAFRLGTFNIFSCKDLKIVHIVRFAKSEVGLQFSNFSASISNPYHTYHICFSRCQLPVSVYGFISQKLIIMTYYCFGDIVFSGFLINNLCTFIYPVYHSCSQGCLNIKPNGAKGMPSCFHCQSLSCRGKYIIDFNTGPHWLYHCFCILTSVFFCSFLCTVYSLRLKCSSSSCTPSFCSNICIIHNYCTTEKKYLSIYLSYMHLPLWNIFAIICNTTYCLFTYMCYSIHLKKYSSHSTPTGSSQVFLLRSCTCTSYTLYSVTWLVSQGWHWQISYIHTQLYYSSCQ